MVDSPVTVSHATIALVGSAVLLATLVLVLLRVSRQLALMTRAAAERGPLQERNAELARRVSQLEANQRSRSEFLLTLSHEMRTPLNAVIAFSQLLQSGPADNRLNITERDWGRRIENAGRHLLNLIDDVLETARIDVQGVQAIEQPFHLTRAAAECVALLSESARSGEVALQLDLPPQSTVVCGDARRFKQILLNLLSNAIKYNRAGGEVLLHLASDDRSIDVRVRDNGLGMTQEQLDQLFVPFNRLGRERDRRYEGTGLGLAITRQLVDALGGSIDVRSEAGRGSEFVVQIPWASVARPPSGTPERGGSSTA